MPARPATRRRLQKEKAERKEKRDKAEAIAEARRKNLWSRASRARIINGVAHINKAERLVFWRGKVTLVRDGRDDTDITEEYCKAGGALKWITKYEEKKFAQLRDR